jgi:hypothetical protein
VGDTVDDDDGDNARAGAEHGADSGTAARAVDPQTNGSTVSPDGVSSLQMLTDAPPAESVTERGVVPVPMLTSLVIGLSVAFTVVFGIVPGPILDFAHQATLLFT